ncbi:MinD/ParA family protein [Bacillus sp. HMF5848]|uniref:MinD/ParA family protein n=1 Tax=Bacillus sp. HMF5848 TaxID=2495421 RepID=UPI000F7BB0EA|nr:MinD/ParA family protein [Bacillus sp. HMF5848]RSK27045.1 MinD/ParA family protein [Bacillus sp. HMF5848]
MSDQAQNLRLRLQNLQQNKMETKAIAVISGKGGVGKSNFALNFSLSLAKKGQRVLLFDMDIGMGNIDILMGVSPENTIVDIFTKQMSIHDIIKKGPHNLSYVAGGTGFSKIFSFDSMKIQFFFDELHKLLQDYDYIIFDMGAGLSEGYLEILMAVHDVFVITTTEPTAITDAYATMKYIYIMDQQTPFYLVVNRAHTEKEGEITMRRLTNAVQQFLQKQVIQFGLLPEDRAVSRAVSSQTPFIIHDPKSNASKALEQMTERYLSKSFESTIPSRSFSFVAKLRQYFFER